MKRLRSYSQGGFTLIELTISVAILASIMLLITTTFIALLRYQQSIISIRTTNQVVRTAFSTISTDGRLGVNAEVITDTVSGYDQLCIRQSSKMLQYYVAQNSTTNTKYGLYIREFGVSDPCNVISSTVVVPGADSSVSSLDTDVVLFKSWIATSGAATGLTVQLGVAMDRNLLAAGYSPSGNNICQAELSPYCSVTTMQTSVGLKGVSN